MFKIGEIIKIIQKPSTGSAQVLHSRVFLDARSGTLRIICRWMQPVLTVLTEGFGGMQRYCREPKAKGHSDFMYASAIIKCITLLPSGTTEQGDDVFALSPGDRLDCDEFLAKYVEVFKPVTIPALSLDSLGDFMLGTLKHYGRELKIKGFSSMGKQALKVALAQRLEADNSAGKAAGGGGGSSSSASEAGASSSAGGSASRVSVGGGGGGIEVAVGSKTKRAAEPSTAVATPMPERRDGEDNGTTTRRKAR